MNEARPIYKSVSDLSGSNLRSLYDSFDSSIATLDCGKRYAPHNQSGKLFCCDTCHAVPAVYRSEWKYLKDNTQLWHTWRGHECTNTSGEERARLKAETPKEMILLVCLGPSRCEREFRALSCRQFPFFPYVSSDYRFLGLAYKWEFESKCRVISNLSSVTQTYRDEFVRAYDHLFALFQTEFDNYAYHSEKLRAEFLRRKKRFPLLHRNGATYLVSPGRGRLHRIDATELPRFAPYP